jgi:hypothetical protein
MLPSFDGVESGCGEPAIGAERIVAQQQERGRLVGFDRGDDGLGCLDWVAGLSAMRCVVFFTPFAGGFGVIVDDGARLGQ